MRKTPGTLNPALARLITEIGHTETIVVTDAGLPIPEHLERIDLALAPNLPTFLQTLRVVIDELEVEAMIGSAEVATISPEMHQALIAISAELNVPFTLVPHTEFKAQTGSARAAVRSGDFTPYANVILQAGVTF